MGDGGPQPADRDVLYRSLVDNAFDLIVTLDEHGVITFANNAACFGLGYQPGGLVGVDALGLIHPDDAERAAQDLASSDQFGAPRGTSSFRLRHRDGRWILLDITSSDATDGTRPLLAVSGRPADDRRATDEVALRLLRGATRAELLEAVCDVFAWQLNGTQVAISWSEPEGRQFVSTGLPPSLAGGDDPAGAPWHACRVTLLEQHGDASSPLDLERRALASARGLTMWWIVPVRDIGGREPALITVWGGANRAPSQVHAYGMSVVRTFVELILRWTDQARQLESAAHHDDLTGVLNRMAFFQRLDELTGPGAVLYCDLDRFKPVNDAYGHAAGDALLRQVARRLHEAVRTKDIVARLGGDEFGVLCPGVEPEEAGHIAQRIEAAFDEPFALGLRSVHVGISVGIGHAERRVSVDTLEAADQALYRVKARRRAVDEP